MATGTLMLAWLLAASPTPGEVYYINQHQLRIPISVDPARRAEIKELILFMSADEGKTWHEQAVASPDQEAFPFYAPKDGTYWFSVCVINQQNKREPADIYTAPPSQKIVIDTLKPLLRIKSAERQGEDVVVNWEIQEDHPDPNSLKLEYRTPDAPPNQWMPAPISQAAPGQTRVRLAGTGPVSLRLQVQDLAGNAGSADYDLSPAAQVAAMPPVSNPSPVVPASTGAIAANAWETPRGTQASPLPKGDARPSLDLSPPPTPSVPASSPPEMDTGNRVLAESNRMSVPAAAEPLATRLPRGQLPPLQIVNTKQIALDYEVTKAGPSGIGKVELWMTQDDGKSWEKFAENPTLKPPLTVELPAEGIFGFRLVLQSKAGRYKPPPTTGDLPEMRLELDTTPPTAQLFEPTPDPKQADALILTWSATDRNLAPRPVTLQWAEQPTKEWQTIAADLTNDGHYTWKLPKDIPYQVFLRLTVRDTAGNVSTAETRQPVCIDLVKPEGHLLGLAGAARQLQP
jgi:hypothetical protein